MIGQTIQAILRLYRAHWQPYLSFSVTAHLWALSVFVSLILPAVVYASTQNIGLTVAAIPVALLAFLYGQGMFRVNALTISRLALGALAGQPETPQQVFKQVKRSLWPLLGLDLMIGFHCLAPVALLSLALKVLDGISPDLLSHFSYLLESITSLILLWMITRLSLAKLHYVVDQTHSMGYALQYSMAISERQFLHIIAHNMLIWLSSNILSLVCLLVTITGLWTMGGLGQFLSQNIFALGTMGINYFSLFSIYLGSIIAAMFIPNIVSLPIRQIAKGSLYYSLRMKTANGESIARY